jgi:predicted ferric reductase
VPIVSVFSLYEPDIYINIIRLAALLGYTSIFVSIMLTKFLREVRKIFGQPFLKVHHWFAIIGLISITVHPIALAIYSASLLVFIPDFSSWLSFWALAGRPALYLAYIATVVALLRNRIKKYWRFLHGLMYVVLTFAFVHGYLIGTDFTNPVIAILYLGMLVLTYIVAILKRTAK